MIVSKKEERNRRKNISVYHSLFVIKSDDSQKSSLGLD